MNSFEIVKFKKKKLMGKQQSEKNLKRWRPIKTFKAPRLPRRTTIQLLNYDNGSKVDTKLNGILKCLIF